MKMTSADVSSLVLMPGDIYFGDANIVLKTLLGSCVSIVLWHPKLKLGGMCHFVLPRRLHPGGESLDGRYADEAVQLFMADLTRQRTLPEDYRVHVFGGANMFHLRPITKIPGPANSISTDVCKLNFVGLSIS